MNNNKNKQQMSEDYNRAAGSAGAQQTEDGKPVMDSIDPIMLLIAALVFVAFLGLLGWGVIIVFGM